MSPAIRQIEQVRRVITDAIAGRIFPAASIDVGTADTALWSEAFGALTFEAGAGRTTSQTVFDLASLTKVVATSTIAMRLIDDGLLQLDSTVRAWLPEWTAADRQGVTIRDLLEHCSGLPAWAPLFETCRGRNETIEAINRCALAYHPRASSIYSDLGFILLGYVLETAGHAALDRQWTDMCGSVWADSGGLDLAFRPPASWRDRTAPTREDSGRGRLLVGEVDDDNAWALGGVAGHAGLFGTSVALGRFARALMRSLSGDQQQRQPLAYQATARMFVTPSSVPGSSRALGWDTMRPTSSCGTRMTAAAFGHTGSTGTSLWIDPVLGLYVVLLTNRVHPRSGPAEPIQQIRRAVHDAVF